MNKSNITWIPHDIKGSIKNHVKDTRKEEEEAKQAIYAMAEKAKEKIKTKEGFRSVRDLQFKDN